MAKKKKEIVLNSISGSEVPNTPPTVIAKTTNGVSISASLIAGTNPETQTLYVVPQGKILNLTSAWVSGTSVGGGGPPAPAYGTLRLGLTSGGTQDILSFLIKNDATSSNSLAIPYAAAPVKLTAGITIYGIANLIYGVVGFAGWLEDA